jgi:8-oxo-dGTP pyrophosphatase MutT (NUDIX family)
MSRKPRQYAALPYREAKKGRIEVLLITSHGAGRWLIPKGWPMKGRKPHETAA